MMRGMRTEDVIRYYRTQKAAADALGIRQSSVAEWGDYPPAARQLQIQKVTRGKLKAEPFDQLFIRAKTRAA
jgi:DNA-binding transcriptional regulator YdaS (Cro superfamily)